jgi:hypothetical protein
MKTFLKPIAHFFLLLVIGFIGAGSAVTLFLAAIAACDRNGFIANLPTAETPIQKLSTALITI